MVEFKIAFPFGLTCIVGKKHLFEAIYDIVEDKVGSNGIPIAQEIEAWAELCHIGEEYEADGFIVKCVDSERCLD